MHNIYYSCSDPVCPYWIATAFIYDSSFTGNLSPSTEEQQVRSYCPAVHGDKLMVTAISWQQQEGNTDCRLFSIAAAYHSALGYAMSKVCISQTDSHGHLRLANVGFISSAWVYTVDMFLTYGTVLGVGRVLHLSLF